MVVFSGPDALKKALELRKKDPSVEIRLKTEKAETPKRFVKKPKVEEPVSE